MTHSRWKAQDSNELWADSLEMEIARQRKLMGDERVNIEQPPGAVTSSVPDKGRDYKMHLAPKPAQAIPPTSPGASDQDALVTQDQETSVKYPDIDQAAYAQEEQEYLYTEPVYVEESPHVLEDEIGYESAPQQSGAMEILFTMLKILAVMIGVFVILGMLTDFSPALTRGLASVSGLMMMLFSRRKVSKRSWK